jgi:hypothetical protein
VKQTIAGGQYRGDLPDGSSMLGSQEDEHAHSPSHPEVHASWVLGLLVVAWVISLFWVMTIPLDAHGRLSAGVLQGSAAALYDSGGLGWFQFEAPEGIEGAKLGRLGQFIFAKSDGFFFAVVPIPMLITALLPLAIGPFTRFRFRLWHYLTFTALVSVQLVYYLRWQE